MTVPIRMFYFSKMGDEEIAQAAFRLNFHRQKNSCKCRVMAHVGEQLQAEAERRDRNVAGGPPAGPECLQVLVDLTAGECVKAMQEMNMLASAATGAEERRLYFNVNIILIGLIGQVLEEADMLAEVLDWSLSR